MMAFMKAEPTTTPSAMAATSLTCSNELTPKPTDRGLSVAVRTRSTNAFSLGGRPVRAPVTPATLLDAKQGAGAGAYVREEREDRLGGLGWCWVGVGGLL